MKRVFAILFLPLISITAFAQSAHCLADRYSQDALFDSTDILITTDVHFATSMRWPGTQMDSLRMDIYQPDPNLDPLVNRPLIIMTHGGSFATGNRTVMAYYCMEMARRGFVTATISYRLGWDCNVMAVDPCIGCQAEAWKAKVATYRAVQDNRAAIRHLVHSASQFGIDTAFIFLQGESAGSIASLNSAFWDQAEADNWCSNCLGFVGELDTAGNDLVDNYTIKGVVNHCGAIPNLDMLDGHQIPVINFHNDPDCVVPYGTAPVINCVNCWAYYWASGSNSIQARLNQNGVCTQRHARQEAFPDHCTYYTAPLLSKSACFLKGILCDDCSSANTTNDFSIPDCSAGTAVSVSEITQHNQVEIRGSQVVFKGTFQPQTIQIYDLSMKLLHELNVNGQDQVQLPPMLNGCMLVKMNSRDESDLMRKWCNFSAY